MLKPSFLATYKIPQMEQETLYMRLLGPASLLVDSSGTGELGELSYGFGRDRTR